jgi:hypothetical protein
MAFVGSKCVDVVLDGLYVLESSSVASMEANARQRRLARLATSSRLLAVFLADCATVALPQMRETEQ